MRFMGNWSDQRAAADADVAPSRGCRRARALAGRPAG
jgi:hypothetical protein